VCVLLSYRMPIILRSQPASPDQFQVAGSCYLHGIITDESLIEPLPSQFRIQYVRGKFGVNMPHYLNNSIKELADEDPRLGPISPDWERAPAERTSDDPSMFTRFKNKVSGEMINSDPRLFPEALEARGVKLETFTLV
jgi:hypothetical protein